MEWKKKGVDQYALRSNLLTSFPIMEFMWQEFDEETIISIDRNLYVEGIFFFIDQETYLSMVRMWKDFSR